MKLKSYHNNIKTKISSQSEKELALEFLEKFIYPRFKKKIEDYPYEESYTLVIEHWNQFSKLPDTIYFRDSYFELPELLILPSKYTKSVIRRSVTIFKEEQKDPIYKYEFIVH